ncbi:unnamed protein product [Linum tenue]|uniref:Uncharacterized protein n=1 Tax=Linum tenue TaxID=586396 RepID=A0AAV0JS98_9ROSI|nr:unnamed protein product [Linum tenue]
MLKVAFSLPHFTTNGIFSPLLFFGGSSTVRSRFTNDSFFSAFSLYDWIDRSLRSSPSPLWKSLCLATETPSRDWMACFRSRTVADGEGSWISGANCAAVDLEFRRAGHDSQRISCCGVARFLQWIDLALQI